MIKNSGWLDAYTKAANIKKTNNIKVFIGYHENCFNSTLLIERFGNVIFELPISSVSLCEKIL